MRYLSVCSGMEAASVAWHPLGWKPVGFSEIEPFPCAILKHRFPNTPNHGSLTEHHTWPIEPGTVDLLVGGTPCQSFSVAGLRKGLADPRGNLALTFLGLADKLKPKWIVWENVPGVLSSGGGRDFGSFLGALVELGYGFAYRVLDAQHFGVPQRRRRVFVVACLGDWRAPAEVLSLREGLRGYLEAGGKKRKSPASDAGSGVETDGLPGVSATVTSKWAKGADAGLACDGSAANIISQYWNGKDIVNTLTRKDIDQLMPDKDNFQGVIVPDVIGTLDTECGGSKLSHQSVVSGHVIPCQPITYDMKQHHNPQPSESVQLTTNNCAFVRGDTPLVQPIPFRKSKQAASTTDNETWVPADVTNTLNNFDLGDTRTTHAVVEPVIPIHDQATRHGGKRGDKQDGKGNGLGVGQPGDPMNTLTRGDHHAVAYCSEVAPTVTSSGPPYSRTGNERVESEALVTQQIYENSRRDAIRIYEGTSPTLQSFMGTGGGNVPMVQPVAFDTYNQSTSNTNQALGSSATDVNHYGAVFNPPMAVRRLTCVECERLQGFPDNWSRIPWKGKPETECPDGPRYKACGNSMAVPVMRWIGERIASVESSSHA